MCSPFSACLNAAIVSEINFLNVHTSDMDQDVGTSP